MMTEHTDKHKINSKFESNSLELERTQKKPRRTKKEDVKLPKFEFEFKISKKINHLIY